MQVERSLLPDVKVTSTAIADRLGSSPVTSSKNQIADRIYDMLLSENTLTLLDKIDVAIAIQGRLVEEAEKIKQDLIAQLEHVSYITDTYKSKF